MGAFKTQNESGANLLNQHQTVDCDECGREVSKLWRRHKGHGYCSTCYARVFKRRMCPRCGELARLPKNDPDAVCRQCNVDKPCARCGKASSDYNIGKVTPYGPVCIACAPYFKEPEPCEACGKASQRLTRVARMGHDHRLCPRCSTADHGTCSACRRHRLLVVAPNGDALCKACNEQGEIACPSCGNPMPAGRGDACEPCYWTRTCRKRITIGQAGITTKALSEAFGEFGEWLIRITGPHKAALKINHFFSFFLELDQAWSRIPSYSELLHHFGAEGLRRVRLPMRWLHEEQGVEPDHQAKRIDSEKRRIQACLSSMPFASLSDQVLQAYWLQLETRIEAGKTSHTSARLALRAAAALLLATDREGQRLPQQGDVDNYLHAVPGQAASVTGFTNFLNRQHATTLAPRVDVKRARKRRKETLARTLMTMARCADQGEAWREAWIVAAMEYFHDTKVTQKMLRQQTVERTTDGIQVVVGGVTYWLPLDIEC